MDKKAFRELRKVCSSLDRCILAIQHTATASPTALNQHPRTDCHLSNSQNSELLINFPSINPKFARISDAKSINRILLCPECFDIPVL